jgi:hypothetical protein
LLPSLQVGRGVVLSSAATLGIAKLHTRRTKAGVNSLTVRTPHCGRRCLVNLKEFSSVAMPIHWLGNQTSTKRL